MLDRHIDSLAFQLNTEIMVVADEVERMKELSNLSKSKINEMKDKISLLDNEYKRLSAIRSSRMRRIQSAAGTLSSRYKANHLQRVQEISMLHEQELRNLQNDFEEALFNINSVAEQELTRKISQIQKRVDGLKDTITGMHHKIALTVYEKPETNLKDTIEITRLEELRKTYREKNSERLLLLKDNKSRLSKAVHFLEELETKFQFDMNTRLQTLKSQDRRYDNEKKNLSTIHVDEMKQLRIKLQSAQNRAESLQKSERQMRHDFQVKIESINNNKIYTSQVQDEEPAISEDELNRINKLRKELEAKKKQLSISDEQLQVLRQQNVILKKKIGETKHYLRFGKH